MFFTFILTLFPPIQSRAMDDETKSFTADDQYKYVVFGGSESENPGYYSGVKWIILDPQYTNGVDNNGNPVPGALLLLAQESVNSTGTTVSPQPGLINRGYEYYNITFDTNGNGQTAGGSNVWEGGAAQQWCIDFYNNENIFTNEQRAMILGVKTNEGSSQYTQDERSYGYGQTQAGSRYFYACDIDGTGDGAKDKIFFLSNKEWWKYSSYGTLGNRNSYMATLLVRSPLGWYLRSPVSNNNDHRFIANVLDTDLGANYQDYIYGWLVSTASGNSENYMRPALDLNLDKVYIIRGNGSFEEPYIMGQPEETYSVTYEYTYIGEEPDTPPTLPTGETGLHKDDTHIVADEPTLEGYKFLGWEATSPTGENAPVILSGKLFMPASDVVITGTWQKVYTITYAYDDSAPDNAPTLPDPVHLAQGVEYTVAPNPSNVYGYTFTGWSVTSPTGEGAPVITDGKLTMPASDVIITGTWRTNSYTITFVDADGTTTLKQKTYPYGTAAADIERPTDPTKEQTDNSPTPSAAGRRRSAT